MNLQETIDKFYALDSETLPYPNTAEKTMTKIGLAVKISRHIAAHGFPRWHDRPTGPGVWCGAINVFTISQRALELMQARGDDWWRVGRVFGPIPPDSQGEE